MTPEDEKKWKDEAKDFADLAKDYGMNKLEQVLKKKKLL